MLAGCIVQAGARLGVGSIINTAAVVEHDSTLEEYVHVAPRAVLCGNTHVGCNSHIGAGAIVRQGLILGSNTLVGAGAVVVKDFEGQGTLIGVPARREDLK
jgi:acetyltransferase-like isoleucine patch superfamily enzyme